MDKPDVLGYSLIRRAAKLGFNKPENCTDLESGYCALDWLEARVAEAEKQNDLLRGEVEGSVAMAKIAQARVAVLEAPPSPGDTICEIHCPCCGADLDVHHGSDEGEIAVSGKSDQRVEGES